MVVKTPPMGWNSWNTFGPNIKEALIRETADAMVDAVWRRRLQLPCHRRLLVGKGQRRAGPSGRFGGEIPERNEGRVRLRPFQGLEIRDVFLRGHFHLRALSVVLRV